MEVIFIVNQTALLLFCFETSDAVFNQRNHFYCVFLLRRASWLRGKWLSVVSVSMFIPLWSVSGSSCKIKQLLGGCLCWNQEEEGGWSGMTWRFAFSAGIHKFPGNQGKTELTLHFQTLSMGFSRQEHWTGLPCPPSGDLLHSGSNPHLMSPALGRGFLTTSTTWGAPLNSLGTPN